MIRMKRIALAFRILGIFLLVAALLLTVVSLSTTGSMWNEMQGKLKNSSVSTNIVDRFDFKNGYFDVFRRLEKMPDAAADQRKAVAAEEFAGFVTLARTQEAVNIEKNIAYVTDYYRTSKEFNPVTWLDKYEQVDEREQEKHLSELFTYLDKLVPPQKGKGKGKGGLNATVRGDFEKYYSTFAGENGEEKAGSFEEFTAAVTEMIKADKEAGKSVEPVAYIKSIDMDRFSAALSEIRNWEKEEQAENLLDLFAVYVRQQAKGEDADYAGYFEKAYQMVKENHPGEEIPEYAYFIQGMHNCLQSGTFYGETADALKAAVSYKNKVNAGAFEKVIVTFWGDMVAEKDKAGTGLVRVYWFCARYVIVFWILAVLLLVAAIVINKLRIKRQIAEYKAEPVAMDDDVLLKVDHLCQYFAKGQVRAVDDVSFDIKKGEVFGLVGESGCGKTTTGRSIIKLYDITSGNIYFKGKRIAAGTKSYTDAIKKCREQMKEQPERKNELREEIKRLKAQIASARFDHDYCDMTHAHDLENEVDARYEKLLANARGEELEKLTKQYRSEKRIARKQRYITQIQMIFQDPVASLDPRMTVRETIAEGLRIRGENDEKVIDEKVYNVLETVGLVREHAGRYPHEFSGGQKQRIGVARAVVMNPEMIIADEPVSALDVSIQAQVINLLNDLRNKMGLTILFIAHDLSVVKYFSDRIGVMYYGHMVELADSDELFNHPLHPYTRSLLSAIPLPDPDYEKDRKRIKYDPHTAHDYSVSQPVMREIVPGHFVRCNDAELEQYKKELGIE